MLTKDLTVVEFMCAIDTEAFAFQRYMHLPAFNGKRYFTPSINGRAAPVLREADAGPVLFLDDLKHGFGDVQFVH